MRKVSTQIPGLDILLHGGIQLYTNTEDCHPTVDTTNCGGKADPDSLVIVIKGAKGVYKTPFAMHLMQGLTASLRCYNQRPGSGKALFYSINKGKKALNDSYLDLIIQQFLKRVVYDYRKERFNQPTNCDDIKDKNAIDGILEFLFDFGNQSRDNLTRFKTDQRSCYILPHITRMICEGIVNYNQRTNSLHFVRNYYGDDNMNLVATRSHDCLQEYLDKLNDGKNELIRRPYDEIAKYFINSLIDLRINDSEAQESNSNKIRPLSPVDKYKAIEDDIYEKWYQECHKREKQEEGGSAKEAGSKQEEHPDDNVSKRVESQPYDCVVIDGFSQLSDSELNDISYSYLTEHLRKLSKITILVFDEREGARCDGDMVIEMKEDYDNEELYMSHQLRIAKSMFQTVVLGWHKYKKRDYGIEVFPSQHMQLSKRYYIQNKSKHIGQSLFDSSINEYLEAKNYRDCILGTVDDCSSKLTFERFLECQQHMADCLHDNIYKQYAEAVNNLSAKKDKSQNVVKDKYKEVKAIFEDVLCFNFPKEGKDKDGVQLNNDYDHSNDCGMKDNHDHSNDCGVEDRIETDHFPSTVIIGNPNSYKRTFALATAHKLACLEHPVHTLFILFDKNELDMRTKMVCPAFYGDCSVQRLKQCRMCDKYIHTYNMRMGCISPNEFFAILQEQISFYCQTSDKTGNEHTWMHIVLDDIQKIQFSFPFLRNTKLFLSALMDICRQNKVRLTILCDKKSELTREVSSIADNVIAIRRNEQDIYHIEFNIERRLQERIPSRIIRLDIRDILHLFRCECRNIHIAFSTEDDQGKDKSETKKTDNGKELDKGGNSGDSGNSIDYSEFFREDDLEYYPKDTADVKYRVRYTLIGSMKGYWRKTDNNFINHDENGSAETPPEEGNTPGGGK